jgi:hypothetical protein
MGHMQHQSRYCRFPFSLRLGPCLEHCAHVHVEVCNYLLKLSFQVFIGPKDSINSPCSFMV